MSTLRNFRLLAPLCGALLLVNVSNAFAQNDAVAVAPPELAPDAVATDAATAPAYPAPAQTPEAAGEMFYQFLAAGAVTTGDARREPFDLARAALYVGAISQLQLTNMMKDLSSRPQSNGVEQLFILLAQQKDEPQYQGVIVGKEGEQTFVEVSPAPAKKRSVVVVPEDGGFRVDLKATYGRWNDLSGEKLDIAWADATGIVSPGLAKNATYLEKRARQSCQVNLKVAMLGVLQYSQDYGEHYPTARKWIDEVFPYVKSQEVFRCPALPEGSNYGYAFNQNLSAISLARMDNVAQTVAISETEDLTRNAFGAGEERAYRHLGGSNIAFADGHIKWFAQNSEKPEEVKFKP